MQTALFFLFGAIAVASALLSVTRKNAVAAACWLVVMFFGLAGEFVLMEAYFVAAVQILVYAGAIMVLFLFVIMLLDLKREELRARAAPRLKVAGIALSVAFLVVVGRVLVEARDGADVAGRVAASLRLPAPPEARPADPLRPGAGPEAPPAAPIALATASAGDVRTDEATAALVAGDGPATRWVGSVSVPDAKGGPWTRALLVAVGRQAVRAWIDHDGNGTFAAREALALKPTPSASRVATFEWVDPVHPGFAIDVVVRRVGYEPVGGGPDGSPFAIGKSLFDEWILPFEVTSVLLLGAIFGAVVLTKRRLS
jgi:NADH-quinone oxidoreductase subunit J